MARRSGDQRGDRGPRLGEARILAVTRKLPAPAGTTQEYGHVVTASDPLLTDPALARVVQGAVDALDLACAVLCVEVMLTASGPRIVEVNGRLGGDLLPLLVHHALGIDLAQVAAALAAGTLPQLEPTRQAAAAIRFAYPETTGVLDPSPSRSVSTLCRSSSER